MSEKLTMHHLLTTMATSGVGTYRVLRAQGYHPNVIVAKMEKAQRKGYAESGVASHLCWLTDKGFEFTLEQRP